MNNRFYEIVLSFSLFNSEFSLGNRLIDIFPNQFFFYPTNKKNNNNVKNQLTNLNNLILQALSDPQSVTIIVDTSIKSQVATLISHIYYYNRPIIKTLHHAVNVMTTEAELFITRYSIN